MSRVCLCEQCRGGCWDCSLVWTCPPCFPRCVELSSPVQRFPRPTKSAHIWVSPPVPGAADTDELCCGGHVGTGAGFWRDSRFCGIGADFAQTMSKLSFRARALDAAKPLPVYRNRDLPDLTDCVSINRAVPQMPSGMEKEEELVRQCLNCVKLA